MIGMDPDVSPTLLAITRRDLMPYLPLLASYHNDTLISEFYC